MMETAAPLHSLEPAASASPAEDRQALHRGMESASARPPTREHLEDDFFAQGDGISSFPPSSIDAPEMEEVVRVPISPRVLARRARMRRIVGGIVGGAALLTSVVMAEALIQRPSAPAAAEKSFSLPSRIVPSIAVASTEEASEAPAAAPPPAKSDQAGAAETASTDDPPASPPRHRLPVVDVEIPSAPDPATDRVWEAASHSLTARDFSGADKAFAELGRRTDSATRETARLARALWWMAHGRQAEVHAVLVDLAANATTPYVQQHASDLLHN